MPSFAKGKETYEPIFSGADISSEKEGKIKSQ